MLTVRSPVWEHLRCPALHPHLLGRAGGSGVCRAGAAWALRPAPVGGNQFPAVLTAEKAPERGEKPVWPVGKVAVGRAAPRQNPSFPHPVVPARRWVGEWVQRCSTPRPPPRIDSTHRPRHPAVSPLLHAQGRICPALSISPCTPPRKGFIPDLHPRPPPLPSPAAAGSREQPAQLPRCRGVHRHRGRRWQPAALEILTTLMCREADKSQHRGAVRVRCAGFPSRQPSVSP